MSEFEISLAGVTLKLRTALDMEVAQSAVVQAEDFLEQIQEATGVSDTKRLLVLALLNRTMELEQMKKDTRSGQPGDRHTIEWARSLANEVQTALI